MTITPEDIAALRSAAEQMAQEIARLLACVDAADAVRELVECEALKDRIDNNDHDGVDRTFAELHAMTEEYQRRKPLAWSRASAIVGDT